jgi:hypothetical protein
MEDALDHNRHTETVQTTEVEERSECYCQEFRDLKEAFLDERKGIKTGRLWFYQAKTLLEKTAIYTQCVDKQYDRTFSKLGTFEAFLVGAWENHSVEFVVERKGYEPEVLKDLSPRQFADGEKLVIYCAECHEEIDRPKPTYLNREFH